MVGQQDSRGHLPSSLVAEEASMACLRHISLQISSWAPGPLEESLRPRMAAPETEAAVLDSALPQTAAPRAEEPQPD